MTTPERSFSPPASVFTDRPDGAALTALLARPDPSALIAHAEALGADPIARPLRALAEIWVGQKDAALVRLEAPETDPEADIVRQTLRGALLLDQGRPAPAVIALNHALATCYASSDRIWMNCYQYPTRFVQLIHDALTRQAPVHPRGGPLGGDKVFYLLSYPRSGNTYVRSALAYLYDSPTYSVFPGDGCFFSPRFHVSMGAPVVVAKTHTASFEYMHAPILNLVRDGRDCMVSYFFFSRQTGEHQLDFDTGFVEFLRNADRMLSFGSWWRSLDAVDALVKAGADVTVARYEDLKRDEAAIVALAEALAPGMLKRRDLAGMSRAAADFRDNYAARSQIWQLTERGEPGTAFGVWTHNRGASNWRSLFSPEARRVFHEAGGTEHLLRHGYETASDWWTHD